MASGEDPTRYGSAPYPQWRGGPQGSAADMSLDIQLSELRRSLDVATTKIDGQLAVLLQKSDYAEQRARESAERVAAELAVRDAKMNHFEARLDAYDTKVEVHARDLNGQLNTLRVRVYFMAGMASALGGAVGIVAEILMRGR